MFGPLDGPEADHSRSKFMNAASTLRNGTCDAHCQWLLRHVVSVHASVNQDYGCVRVECVGLGLYGCVRVECVWGGIRWWERGDRTCGGAGTLFLGRLIACSPQPIRLALPWAVPGLLVPHA